MVEMESSFKKCDALRIDSKKQVIRKSIIQNKKQLEKKKMQLFDMLDNAVKKQKKNYEVEEETSGIKRKIESLNDADEVQNSNTMKTEVNGDIENKKHCGEKESSIEDKKSLSEKDQSRLDKKLAMSFPKLFLNQNGKLSLMSAPQSVRTPLNLKDIGKFLEYTICMRKKYTGREWCKLLRRTSLSQVVVVVVEGLGVNARGTQNSEVSTYDPVLGDLNKESESTCPKWLSEQLPKSATSFPIHLEVQSAESKFYSLLELIAIEFNTKLVRETILDIHKNNIQAHTRIKNLNIKPDGPAIMEKVNDDKYNRTVLLMNISCMISNQYPLDIEGLKPSYTPGYRKTKEVYKEVTANSPMFGVDCEMVKTGNNQHSLVEVSLIDENLVTVYSTLCKPRETIENYLTRYSGVTKRDLVDVKTRLEDVQEFLCNYLPPDAILVGHSLQMDLHALKLIHPYVIDTSDIYNLTGYSRIKPGVKLLTSLFLNREIQREEQVGHNSWEDAAASLELALLKLKHDKHFGDARFNSLTCSDIEINKKRKDINIQKGIQHRTVATSIAELQKITIDYKSHIQNQSDIFELIVFQGIVPSIIVSENSFPLWDLMKRSTEQNATIKKSKDVKELFKDANTLSDSHKFTFVYHSFTEPATTEEIAKFDKHLSKLHSKMGEKSLLLTIMVDSNEEKAKRSGCMMLDVVGQNKKNFV